MGHWVAIKNILKYLRRTKDVLLIYGDEDLIISGYTDVNFQSYALSPNLSQVTCSH